MPLVICFHPTSIQQPDTVTLKIHELLSTNESVGVFFFAFSQQTEEEFDHILVKRQTGQIFICLIIVLLLLDN